MYLLADRLGEDAVNRALARLLARFKFKRAPYPRSIDLIRELRAEVGSPADQALITDLTERITIYDLKVEGPTAARRRMGRHRAGRGAKIPRGRQGRGSRNPLSDRIAIGLFTAEPGRGSFGSENVVLWRRVPIRSGRRVLRFVTAARPAYAGVDPYNFYIDRNSGDNVAPVRD